MVVAIKYAHGLVESCIPEAPDSCSSFEPFALLKPDGEAPEDSTLLPLLASVLDAIVESNEHLQQAAAAAKPGAGAPPPRLTVFHGLRAPPISIEAYLLRIAKYAKCSPACFVHAFVYMMRVVKRDAALQPTPLNVHRLLLSGVLLSAKFLDDRYFNNAFYAKVGGVSTAELNRLEVEMLHLLDYRMNVAPEAVASLLVALQSGSLVLELLAAASGGAVAAPAAAYPGSCQPAAMMMPVAPVLAGMPACAGVGTCVGSDAAAAAALAWQFGGRKRRSGACGEASDVRRMLRRSVEVAQSAQPA